MRDEAHRGGVNELVIQFHIGEFLANLIGDLAPETGGFEDVGLVDRRDLLAATAREHEGETHDTADFNISVDQRIDRLFAALWRRAAALGLTEVETAGQLADDNKVHTGHAFRLERGKFGECRDGFDWAKIRVEAKTFADSKQALLRTHFRLGIIPLRAADGTEQHSVGRFARDQGRIRHRAARGIDRASAEQMRGIFKLMAKESRHGIKHEARFIHHFRTDAVTRQ